MDPILAFFLGYTLCLLIFGLGQILSHRWTQKLDDVLRNCARIEKGLKK